MNVSNVEEKKTKAFSIQVEVEELLEIQIFCKKNSISQRIFGLGLFDQFFSLPEEKQKELARMFKTKFSD